MALKHLMSIIEQQRDSLKHPPASVTPALCGYPPVFSPPCFGRAEGTARARSRDAQASLGNNTESSSPPLHANSLETVVRWALRLERYSKKTVIRNVLLKASGYLDLPDQDNYEAYNKLPRVVKCIRTRCRDDADVQLMKENETGNAFFAGAHVCGDSWKCPTCAAKIEARRRNEVEQIIDHKLSQGRKALFATFTIPHTQDQAAEVVYENIKNALKYLRAGKSFQSFKSRCGFDGLIRSLEVTLGANGWHIHTHEVWFVDGDYSDFDFYDYIQDRWTKACDKYNLIPRGKRKAFKERGFTLGFLRSDYLAKFDNAKYVQKLSSEITLSGVKHGRQGSLHPFQLAELAFAGGSFDKQAMALFMEYSEAFKGKARMFFSKGLKAECLIDEKTDEEIALEEKEKSFRVCGFERHGFKRIVDQNAQGHIQNLAESGGLSAVLEWFKPYPEDPI